MLVSADNLTVCRGASVVLRGVSLTLNAGETLAVLGPNGSGKSSLLRLLAGLGDPAAGTCDCVPAHWIGPDLPLKPALTVHDNLKFWLAMQGGGHPDAILKALHRFEIAHLAERRVRTLSSGQKRRVILSRLFLTPEKLWLLDEPENTLDAAGREMMLTALNEHCGDGGGAVIATHNDHLWNASILLPLPPGEGRGEGSEQVSVEVRHHPLPQSLSRGEREAVLWPAFTTTLTRDLALFRASRADCLQPVLLFLLITLLFPLALAPDTATLAPIAGGLVMMAAFFASLLPLDSIFTDDARDGTLETIMTTAAPLPVYASARMFAHWLANGLPLVVLAPLALTMLGAHIPLTHTILTVIPATLLFTLTGATIAALTLSARHSTLLLALLTAPLYIPVLIFSSAALNQTATTPMLLLWAITALFTPLCPLIAAGCLKLMRD